MGEQKYKHILDISIFFDSQRPKTIIIKPFSTIFEK